MKTPLRFLVLLAAVLPAAAAVAPLSIMPAPAHAVLQPGQLKVSASFTVATTSDLDPVIVAAVGRTLSAWNSRSGLKLTAGLSAEKPDRANLVIDCPWTGAATPGPALGEDESYTLDISARQAVLKAKTVSGVIHGLASLQQLFAQDEAGWYLPAVSIQDAPRFPWRGLLIDVSRRWKPIPVLKRNLDAMALVKLNVFHFHLTDDQGFRIECKSHPELTSQGSDGVFYTQAEIKDLIFYAAARGIRVVPEFDLPGHATSWLVSHPELASAPGPFLIERHWGVMDPVMDPTNEATYVLLKDVFTEMAALFPDPYFHIGGDENNGVEWSGNARIQAFIRDHKLGDNPGLQAYFNRRAGAILTSLGKRMVGWDEILHPDLPRGDVIESWRGAEALATAAQMGFSGILANGYYLDSCMPAAFYYHADPLPAGSRLSPPDRARVMGGEVSMWGEWVSAEIVDSRIWPRAAAIAERLWSPASVNDDDDMYRRLEIVDLRLAEVGTEQRSYVAPALNRLYGRDPNAVPDSRLARFIEVIQPVTQQLRGKQQPTSEQWTQLTGIADIARPDNPVARHFAQTVKACLADPGAHAKDRAALRVFFRECILSGQAVAEILAPRFPALATAGPLGFQLADAAQVGNDALEALSAAGGGGGRPYHQDQALALARLGADAEPHDAAMVAIIEPIRELVLAAAAAHKSPSALP